VFRRISGEAFSGVAAEGVLLDVDPRTPATAGEKTTEGSGMGEGDRSSQAGEAGQADKQHFDCATWLHKARQMPKEDFKKEVEKELTGRETEPFNTISPH
jgi:hypothetical protein